MIRFAVTFTCITLGSTLAQSTPPGAAKEEQASEATATQGPQPAPDPAETKQEPKPTPEPAAVKQESSAPQQPTQPVEQVVVTAEKWGGQSVLDLPRSVTPITGELLRDAGVQSIEDAARFVPNTMFTGFTARRLSFPYVRGVGSGQGDPAVATFVDDVPQLNVSSTNLSLVGLDRIEILRGPSGALWGRNTIGGAINLITKEPSPQPGAELFGSMGNYGSQRYEVRATGPVTDPITNDTLAMSVSASYERRDGFSTNELTGNDIDFRDSTFARTQLLWTPDDRNTVRLSIYGEHTRDGGFVLSSLGATTDPTTGQPVPGTGLRDNPYRINQDFEGRTDRDILAGSIVWKHEGRGFDFTSITSAQGWEIAETSDSDFSALDIIRRSTGESEDYAYQEFRLQSAGDYDPSDRDATGMRWLVGLSGFVSDEERSATNAFGNDAAFAGAIANSATQNQGEFRSWSISAFGQVSTLLGNGFELSGALRVDHEDKEAKLAGTFVDPSGASVPTSSASDCRTFSRILPRASITYRPNDDVTSYLTIARGFKAGGFNLTAPGGQESFGTETSWTYEIGIKSLWLDDRVQANAALFLVDWDDMQLSQYDAASGSGYVSNAGQSRSQGFELEVVGEARDGLKLFGTAGYLDTNLSNAKDQYSDDLITAGGTIPGLGQISGTNLPFAPDWTFGVGAQYEHQIDEGFQAFARIDHFRVGQFYYDVRNVGGDQYNLTNLRAGLNYKNWRVDMFVHNVLEEEYVPIALQFNPTDPNQFVGQNGTPRIWGLSVRVTF